MDFEVTQIFEALERYVGPIISSDSYSQYSKQENIILALQSINRLNLKIGRIARTEKDDSGSIRLFQTYVNSTTIALKNENIPMLRAAMASLRKFIEESPKLK